MNEYPKWVIYLLTVLPRPIVVVIVLVLQGLTHGLGWTQRSAKEHPSYAIGMIAFIPPIFIALTRSYAASSPVEIFVLYLMSMGKWWAFCLVTIGCILIPCAIVMGLFHVVDYYRDVDTTLPKREKKESDE